MPTDAPLILTIGLDTGSTTATLWSAEGQVATVRLPIELDRPAPGRIEQDPDSWWRSTVAACRLLPAVGRRRVAAVGFSSQRETFVPVAADHTALGVAIASSDRRAGDEAERLAGEAGGADAFRAATGVEPDGRMVAAKIAWLQDHEPERMSRAEWILSPRDLVALRLARRAVADPTIVSRTGLATLEGRPRPGAELLPPIVTASTVIGHTVASAAGPLGIPVETPIVAGAGDRACEVLGSDASGARPLLSCGAAAHLSVPIKSIPVQIPIGFAVSIGALGGYLLETQVAAADSVIAWVSDHTGVAHDQLLEDVSSVPAGAQGLCALPWVGGALCPWWEPNATPEFIGLDGHGPAEMARAMLEGVAFEVVRALERVAPDAAELTLQGGLPWSSAWPEILANTSGLPVMWRDDFDAVSAGAAIVTAMGIGVMFSLARLDPQVHRAIPDPSVAAVNSEARRRSDEASASAIAKVRGV